ncbi:hypothetical protein PG984_006543 [Apiospora sp. TS-2023a]
MTINIVKAQILDYVSSALCLAILITRISLERLPLKRRRARSPHPFHGCRVGDSGKFSRGGRPYSPQPVMARPSDTNTDVGESGETRFFMIKSVDTRNIFTCWNDKFWPTTLNEKSNFLVALSDTSKNVVLFF